MATYYNYLTRQTHEGVSGDTLFTDDDQMKPLPKLTGVAVGMAVRSGQCFTRQRTVERCERVRDSIADVIAKRGLDTEIRPGKSGETFGLYLRSR